MPKLRPVQESFASGEITPRLRSRPDLKFFRQGAELVENFITSPYGSLARRGGTQFIDEITDTLIYGRIFTFRVEASNTFVVVVTEDEVSVYNTTSAELLPGGSLLANPSFDSGSAGWNSNIAKDTGLILSQEPSITFPSGDCIVNSGNGAHVATDTNPPEPVTTVTINASEAELTQLVSGLNAANEHTLTLAVNSFNAQGVLLDYLSIGTTEGGNEIGFTVDPMDSSVAVFTPGVANVWISYKLEYTDSLNVSVAGQIDPGPVGGANEGSPAIVSFNSLTLVDTIVPGGTDVVDFPSPWSEQQVRELQVEIAPGQGIMYMVVRATFTTKKLIRDNVTGAWTFEDVVYTGGVGDPPTEWAATGYPGTIAFFQGRMWLGGTIEHPVTVWGSVAGEDNYENFDIGAAAADDALELPMARNGVIQWLQGGKALQVGLDDSEHVISGGTQNDLLTPTNARAFQQSSYGSARIHGKWFSEKVSFISDDRRRIYVGDYDRETLGFKSDELSYIAEHITIPGLTEAAFSQNPRAHIWCVRADGQVVAATYQREAETIGWHHHKTDGTIKSLTITEEFGTSIVWILVERQDKLYLEKSGAGHMDSFVVRQYQVAQNVVDGLDHLEGLVVQVIGDGAYAGAHTVTGGQVTVQYDAQSFIAGLPYRAKFISNPIEVITTGDNLTAKLVRWSRIYARLYMSIAPIINGVRGGSRTAPTPMGLVEPVKTQDISVATAGWDRDAKIIIDQDLPFPTEVVGLYGELQEDGF